MIVTCQACRTRYLTDPALLGPSGRMVRCAKCSHTWLEPAPVDMPRVVDMPPPPIVPSGSPPRFNLPARIEPRSRGRFAQRLAVAVLLVGALVAGIILFARERIVDAWPEAERVYEMIGGAIGAPASNLDLSHVQVVRQPRNGIQVVVLQGEIINRTEHPQSVPALRVELFDGSDHGVMDWTFESGHGILQPGEIGSFRTEATNPPRSFERTRISFVPQGD